MTKTDAPRAAQIYLVHHAEAVSPAIDAQRPLSRAGVEHADRLAARARDLGVKPAAIRHSGKLRSRQTAEAFWRACNPLASFSAVRGLRPEDGPTDMRHALDAEADDVLLVGHMPNLPALRRLLTGNDEFPLHGLVWIERAGDGSFREKLVL